VVKRKWRTTVAPDRKATSCMRNERMIGETTPDTLLRVGTRVV
jgi:hypothetical protein